MGKLGTCQPSLLPLSGSAVCAESPGWLRCHVLDTVSERWVCGAHHFSPSQLRFSSFGNFGIICELVTTVCQASPPPAPYSEFQIL